jgi:hypothetical protein
MAPYDSRWLTALFMLIVGLALMVYGFAYNIGHISSEGSQSLESLFLVGYLIVVSIPIVLRRWVVTPVLIGITMGIYAWMVLTQ